MLSVSRVEEKVFCCHLTKYIEDSESSVKQGNCCAVFEQYNARYAGYDGEACKETPISLSLLSQS